MRVVFFGTSAFAVPSLAALVDAGHNIALVVSQPDRPAGRGQRTVPAPVVQTARDLGLSIAQPAVATSPELLGQLTSLAPDIIVVVSYGHRIPDTMLALPRYRCVNVHPSLLPKYRGAAPINWPILNGDTETGVTTMYMASAMDAGDMLLQVRTPIAATETAAQLHDRLAITGAELLCETLRGLAAGTITAHPQDAAHVTVARKLTKEDGIINWRLPAQQIIRQIRGLQPWPTAHTLLQGLLLKIYAAEIPADRVVPAGATPGEIIAVTRSLQIVTGDGRLCLTDVQQAGKRRMLSDEFLRGFPVPIGVHCT